MAATKTKAATTRQDTLPVEGEKDVHHMVRTLSERDMVEGAIGPDTADQHVKTWLDQGYDLHTVAPLGNTDINGVFALKILYIFTRG